MKYKNLHLDWDMESRINRFLFPKDTLDDFFDTFWDNMSYFQCLEQIFYPKCRPDLPENYFNIKSGD